MIRIGSASPFVDVLAPMLGELGAKIALTAGLVVGGSLVVAGIWWGVPRLIQLFRHVVGVMEYKRSDEYRNG